MWEHGELQGSDSDAAQVELAFINELMAVTYSIIKDVDNGEIV